MALYPALVLFYQIDGTCKGPSMNFEVCQSIQQALKDKGFYNGAIDGNIASADFQQALKSFKQKNGLNPDFVIGGKVKALLGLSWASMRKEWAR